LLDMAAADVSQEPSKDEEPPATAATGSSPAQGGSARRYRPLPTGTHGLDPEAVKRDQRERLQNAIIELIAQKGYSAVRIVDLARLAHVSQPTFYSLYTDKEQLCLSAYEKIAMRTASTVMQAYGRDGSPEKRQLAAMRAFAELAAAEPEAMSLLMHGAFGAGGGALERRKLILERLEANIRSGEDGSQSTDTADLTFKVILGGTREFTAARLREGRQGELPGLADELAAWARSYPRGLPAGLAAPVPAPRGPSGAAAASASERAQRAEGRLPSGRSDLPRRLIVKSQRERIVDATAAIVAEKGLGALTVPEIARRANVSHQTFYDIYGSKHDALLGTQKVGMHQALQVAVEVFAAHGDDWPSAVAASLRALIDFLASEPAHARLNLVDAFAAGPEAIEIRDSTLRAFAAYLRPGCELAPEHLEVPAIAPEVVAGGVWEVLHHYIEDDRIAELPGVAPQLIYLTLIPFLGPEEAARVAMAPTPSALALRS